MSPHLYPEAESLALKFGVTPLGYIPKLKDGLTLESRHLGLVTAEEVSNFDTKVSKLADVVSQTVDIEKLLQVAKCGSLAHTSISHMDGKRVRVAVSKDVAFSFLYGDNVDFLERSNCEVVYFSPLNDKELPNGVDGLILCGGYPELYADRISKNVSMRESIKRVIDGGIPYLAECGGFMYLQSNILLDGVKHPMVGTFNGDCYKTDKLVHFGYTKLISESNGERMFNEPLITHEFHYSDTTDNGSDYLALKLNGTQSWRCGYGGKNFYAGYPHIYFYGNVCNINRFISAMVEYRNFRNLQKGCV
jgi:cobyrinic acid a,c-diamide synthase